MKCLTICQPYAHLIVTPQAELGRFSQQKRVENRTWGTSYRGPLLIHAGRSKAWLRTYPARFGGLVYGAIVGVVSLIDCVKLPMVGVVPPVLTERYPWIVTHEHTEGPYCWILDGARRFSEPIPLTGRQGLFFVADCLVREQLEACGWTTRGL